MRVRVSIALRPFAISTTTNPVYCGVPFIEMLGTPACGILRMSETSGTGGMGWKTFEDRTESEQEVSGADVKLSDSVSRNLRRLPKKSKTDRSNLRQYAMTIGEIIEEMNFKHSSYG